MWFRNIFNLKNRAPRHKHAAEQPTEFAAVGLDPRAIHQLDRLQINASRFLVGRRTGLRPSARRRLHLEFREHRMYIPGDDVRFVDWKASARQEQIFVKLGEHYKEATIYVLLDCSGSMAWGEPQKANLALRLSALLGYLSMNHGDRFFIVPFSQSSIQVLGPIQGKGQIPSLLNYLGSLKMVGEADFMAAGRDFLHRFGHTPGLVFVLSDFIQMEDPEAFLDLFPAPKWDLVFLHLLHPEELVPSTLGDYEFMDIETGQTVNLDITEKALTTYTLNLSKWLSCLDMSCVDRNAFYLRIPAAAMSDHDLIHLLRENSILQSQ